MSMLNYVFGVFRLLRGIPRCSGVPDFSTCVLKAPESFCIDYHLTKVTTLKVVRDKWLGKNWDGHATSYLAKLQKA